MRQRRSARLPAGSIAPYWCCLALALLPACQPSGPDSPFKRYLSQLELALSLPSPVMHTTSAPRLPEAGALQRTIPASIIDRLDFLQLSGCAVQANIGKRQIDLGRFAKPSQRLLLELEYLRLAPACIQRLRDANQPALADSLDAARRDRQTQLPALIFNATLGSAEYRALWLAAPAAADYPRSDSHAMGSALAAINELARHWLNGDYHTHNRDFELLLSEVAGGDGGMRLRDWSRQIDWLETADLMLAKGLATVNRTAMANAYFIDVLEPLITRSQLRYLEILAPVTALETQLGDALPRPYRHWIADRNQRVATLTRAVDKHLELLCRARPTCGIE